MMITMHPAVGRQTSRPAAEPAVLLPALVGGLRAVAAAARAELALARTCWRAEDPIHLVPRVLRA